MEENKLSELLKDVFEKNLFKIEIGGKELTLKLGFAQKMKIEEILGVGFEFGLERFSTTLGECVNTETGKLNATKLNDNINDLLLDARTIAGLFYGCINNGEQKYSFEESIELIEQYADEGTLPHYLGMLLAILVIQSPIMTQMKAVMNGNIKIGGKIK